MKIDIEKSLIYRFDDNTDLSEAVLMLGVKGYFSDDKDFSDYTTGTLTRVVCWLEKTEYTFVGKNEESSDAYRYFIPEYKVVFKEEPKKYRPFKNISEFSDKTGCTEIGRNVLTMKYKFEKTECVLLYVGYIANGVCLGGFVLNFETLLDQFEFYHGGKWQLFGVEE